MVCNLIISKDLKVPETKESTIKNFIETHYRHFNAAVVVDAAEAWVRHLDKGGKMFLAMGGAMSTAENDI